MWIVELWLNTLGASVLSGGTWSALNEAAYAVGPRAENLRITEIMYHPQNPDEESIELANVGDETVNLSLMRFTHDVDSVFGSVDLAAGELAVVIHDRIAFETRHGTGVRIAGSYTNDRYEYVELQNIGNEPVTLHNPAGVGPGNSPTASSLRFRPIHA